MGSQSIHMLITPCDMSVSGEPPGLLCAPWSIARASCQEACRIQEHSCLETIQTDFPSVHALDQTITCPLLHKQLAAWGKHRLFRVSPSLSLMHQRRRRPRPPPCPQPPTKLLRHRAHVQVLPLALAQGVRRGDVHPRGPREKVGRGGAGMRRTQFGFRWHGGLQGFFLPKDCAGVFLARV